MAVAAVGLVLATAACGGGGSSGTTSTAASGNKSATQWAGGVCAAFTTWQKSLESIRSSVGGGMPSTSKAKKAAGEIQSATATLVDSLQKLGKPDTATGQKAEQKLAELQASLAASKSKIDQAAAQAGSGNALSAVSTMAAQLALMAHGLTAAVGNLKSFQPGGELAAAFRKAPVCAAYVGS